MKRTLSDFSQLSKGMFKAAPSVAEKRHAPPDPVAEPEPQPTLSREEREVMVMKKMICCCVVAMCIVAGARAVELENGAEFAMAEIPVEAKAELPKGGSIRFLLEENATTGYEWSAAYSSNEVEVVVEHRGPLVKDGRCGAPGVAAVRANLKGNDAAPVFIEMKYARAWEKGSPAKTMRIVLYKVKDGITNSNYPESRTLAMLKEECRNRGIVITDRHVHIRGGLTPEMAAERERLCGIRSSAMENHGREWENIGEWGFCRG